MLIKNLIMMIHLSYDVAHFPWGKKTVMSAGYEKLTSSMQSIGLMALLEDSTDTTDTGWKESSTDHNSHRKCPKISYIKVWDKMHVQTVQTQIRLLLKEQSDLGLHCLPIPLSILTNNSIERKI